MSAKIQDLLGLIKRVCTVFMTTHDLLLPVIPGRLVYLCPQEGITVWVCADPLGHSEEHWSQAACSSSPERL